MKDFPKPEEYEEGLEFIPWGILIERVLDNVQKDAPKNGRILDLMCGPGHLLGRIAQKRGDLRLEGVDISREFIKHAKRKYPAVSFRGEDVLSWNTEKKYDVVLCTGGIHHLPYNRQEVFLAKIPGLLNPNGFAVLADPYIDDYSNEGERKQAAAKLGYEYIVTAIRNGAPDNIVKGEIDILYNDILGFEYKTSLKKIRPVLERLFSQIKITKIWPNSKSEYGDYFIVCR